MDQLATIIGAIGGLLIILGGGIKWLMIHIENKIKIATGVTEKLQAQLALKTSEEFSALKSSILKLENLNAIYMKRIYQLEKFVHKQPGIEIPDMLGWPP